jgi:polyhydroxybutyrate depolymerase
LFFITGIGFAEKMTTPLLSGDRLDSLIHQGIRRTFLVHIPEKLSERQTVPLVIVLHGGGGSPAAVARLTGFSKLADAAGFIVVYPQAVNRHWNDGRNVTRFRAHREKIDDSGFIAALIDTLSRRLKIDPARIYACGISNGGMMCQRLGIELSHRLAAIATVAAALPENLLDSFQPARPLAVLMINGTADPVVPYEGGPVGINAQRGRVLSVEQTARLWAEFNRCSPPTVDTVITRGNDSTRIVRISFSRGRDGTEVILYRIIGGGHVWPGGERRHPLFGRYVRSLNATRTIWEFFSRHARH